MSCSEYLTHLRGIALQLSSCGYEVTDQDLALCLFAGLPPEYNQPLGDHAHGSACASNELHGLFLNYGARLSSHFKYTRVYIYLET
jgi:hypothetical protein